MSKESLDKPKTGEVESSFSVFMRFIWNAEQKQFLGRTGSSWGELFVLFFCAMILSIDHQLTTN